jgi:hypothetical protein
MRHVDAFGVSNAARAEGVLLAIEAVHAALRPGQFAGPVARGEHRHCRMVDVVRRCKADRLQCDQFALRVTTFRDGVGAGISLKEVVETPVLLNDVDDVLDLARARNSERA